MANGDEERIVAKGLKSPGPLLMVKKRLAERGAFRIRVIVSDDSAAREIVSYLKARGAIAEIDKAGADFHVVADLRSFRRDSPGEGDASDA